MSQGRTWHWRVSGSAVQNGESQQLTLTVQTGEKDDQLAAEQFRNHARDIGYTDVSAEDVRLLGER